MRFGDIPALNEAGKYGKVYDVKSDGSRGDFIGWLSRDLFKFSRDCVVFRHEVNPRSPWEFRAPGLMKWSDPIIFEENDF